MQKEPAAEDDLSRLFPDPYQCQIGEDAFITIEAMDIKKCSKFGKLIRPFMKEAADGGIDLSISERTVKQILFAAIDHSDELFEALAIGTNKSVAYIEKLPPLAPVPILHAILKVNIDFFHQYVQTLAPDVQAIIRTAASNDGAGLTR